MNWDLVMEKSGRKPVNKHGATDKFRSLRVRANDPPARVAITVGQAQDYGAMKVSATVSLECDQDEGMINKAGEIAFFKAVELLGDGWKLLVEDA